jgi:hypothetical protein
VFWVKGAALLLTAGLLIAIIPRLLNLGHLWLQRLRLISRIERIDFLLTFFSIIAATINAFVHSRDAYAMVLENVTSVTSESQSCGRYSPSDQRLSNSAGCWTLACPSVLA